MRGLLVVGLLLFLTALTSQILLEKSINLIGGAFPIDAVITWVDGDDPTWQETKRYFQEKQINFRTNINQSVRWANVNELYYCLQGITRNLPWIRRIYLVTMRPQRPNYLQEFPKVQVIHHDDIFPDGSYLPTFNSLAIETQLHRIPGLADHFIYFNDDTFVNRPLKPSYFFNHLGQAQIYQRSAVNRYNRPIGPLIKQRYGIIPQQTSPPHQAYPLLKRDFKLIWKLFPEEMERTASSRFRHPSNLWMVGVIYQLCDSKLSHPHSCHRKEVDPRDQLYYLMKPDMKHDDLKDLLTRYQERNPSLICINSLNANDSDHRQFFDDFAKMFSQKS